MHEEKTEKKYCVFVRPKKEQLDSGFYKCVLSNEICLGSTQSERIIEYDDQTAQNCENYREFLDRKKFKEEIDESIKNIRNSLDVLAENVLKKG